VGVTLKTPHVAAVELTRVLYGLLFAQVDPSRLAEDERSERIVEEYRNLLQLRSDDLQGGGLQRLVADYSSHQFVIDRDEAKEWLFKNVASPVPAEQLLIAVIGMLEDHPLEKRSFCAILPAGCQKKEETMDIEIRERTKSIWRIEFEKIQETSEYLRRRRESMRGIRQSRPKGEREPFGAESPESIEAFLKKAFG